MYEAPEDEDETYWFANDGLALYRGGDFFEAHEVWEHAWVGEVGRRKLTLQALILIAAGLYKAETGNRRGPSKLLAKAVAKLDELLEGGSSGLGLDLVALRADAERALAEADAFARGEREVIAPPTLPESVSPHGVIYLHGFASSPASAKARQIVPALEAEGYAVRVPDLNEGGFEGLTLTRALAQAKRLLFDRTLVIGSSFGGYVAARLAERDDRVKALVLMAPAFDFMRRLGERHGEAGLAGWRAEGRVMVPHHGLGADAPIGYGLYADAANHPAFPKVRAPTYVLHGRADDVVPLELSERFAAETAGVELDVVDADHGLVDEAGRALDAARRLLAGAGVAAAPSPHPLEAARARALDAAPLD